MNPLVAPPRPGSVIRPITRDDFDRLVASAIPAVRLHCYRLVGALDDAEDMVQEALVRAWQHRERLSEPAGLRPWLYRIATNACLDLLGRRRRESRTVAAEFEWPDPAPDEWFAPGIGGGDPADVLVRKEEVGLAFLAAVHRMPPRQRAMLVLRDVLEWSASDIARALDTTVTAVYSGVRRARSSVHDRSSNGSTPTPELNEVEARLARGYLEAWERADVAALAELLAADARMAMPPDPRVFQGRDAIVAYLEAILGEPSAQRIRLTPTSANAKPAFIVLAPDPGTDVLRRIGVKVILARGQQIVEIRGYMRAELAARFVARDQAR